MILAATVPVGASETGLQQISVMFPNAFAAAPVVVASALQDPDYPTPKTADTFAVSITGVQKDRFTANICRADSPGTGWGQALRLGYIAASA